MDNLSYCLLIILALAKSVTKGHLKIKCKLIEN